VPDDTQNALLLYIRRLVNTWADIIMCEHGRDLTCGIMECEVRRRGWSAWRDGVWYTRRQTEFR